MENTEKIPSDLEKDIEAAKKAVRYFESLTGAAKALVELAENNCTHARLILDELEAEQTERNHEE